MISRTTFSTLVLGFVYFLTLCIFQGSSCYSLNNKNISFILIFHSLSICLLFSTSFLPTVFSTSHFSVSFPGLCFHLIPVCNLVFFSFPHPLLSQLLFLTLAQSIVTSTSLLSSLRIHKYICTHTLLPN